MAVKPRALIIGAVQFATQELKELRTRYDIEYYSSKSREQFFEDCKTKYAGAVAAWLGYEALPTIGIYNKEFVDHLPERYKRTRRRVSGRCAAWFLKFCVSA